MKNVSTRKLIALILMLFPVISIIGLVLYIIEVGKANCSLLEIVLLILSIPFGIFASIFLWLNALGVINLSKK